MKNSNFIPYLAYEASAGSGKTFNLVVRYLSLLFMDQDASKILALTFTNKAASEMQERIIETLKTLPTRYELEVISDVTGLSKELILDKRHAVLQRFLSVDTKIYTLDKFFAKILRKFSLYVGLMPDFSSAASQHEIKLMARFLNEVVVAQKEKVLINLSLMSSKRLSDIFTLLDRLYVKRKEMKHIEFKACAYADFENEALHKVKKLSTLVQNSKVASATAKNSMNIKTFEELLAKSWLTKESLNYRTYSKCFEPEMDELLVEIQALVKSRMQAYEAHFFYELMQLLDIYEASKRAVAKEDSEVSFDDITSLVYYLLKERDIDSEFLYFRLDANIEHILLDEFQDTSVIQFEILAPLIDEIVSGNGVNTERSFFFVGDVKQSIYRFRGGVSALFGEVATKYGVEVKPLVVNYRSEKEVVQFVNSVFLKRIKNYIPQEVKEGNNAGFVEVVQHLEPLVMAMTKVQEYIELGVNINDIAILTATNGDGSSVAQALKDENIEVVTETTSKLIYQNRVAALIEYLKYCYFYEEIYSRNFFALIKREPHFIKRYDFEYNSLAVVVKKVVDEYALFQNDINVLRLIEVLEKYSDIEQFLFEYERLDIEAVQSDLNGVRVLTVHKSKGLEFEHVIVLDRLKKAPPNRDALIYDYDGVTLLSIYLRTKSREFFDLGYSRALDKEKALSYEDSLNALYVAFTRAERSLIVIQKEKDSWFGFLDLELKSYGRLQLEKKEISIIKKDIMMKYQNFYYGSQMDLLAMEDSDKYLDYDAIEFGLALHYMLEMIGEFSKDNLDAAFLVMKSRYSKTLNSEHLEEIYRRVAMLIEDKIFLELTSGILHKEQAISYHDELRYLDLLIEKEDNCWVIIDYKSAFGDKKKYYKQVGFYKKAVKAITGGRVESYLCFVLDNSIVFEKV